MKRRKINLILTAAALALLLLTACAGNPAGTVPGTLPAITEVPATADGRTDAPETESLPGGASADTPVTSPEEGTALPTELPGTEDPGTEGTAEGSAPEESTTNESTAEESSPDESTPEESTPAESTADDPAAESRLGETASAGFFRTRVPDYRRPERWAWREENPGKPVDLFFVGPTVVEEGLYMRLTDRESLDWFRNSLAQERGLYDEVCTLYAPFYRQMSIKVYGWPREEQNFWRDQAYRDVATAFRYYLDHLDTGKPLILAGFSQGAEQCLRLMQDFFNPAEPEGAALLERLVAVYAIGAGLPEAMTEEYPWMKPAESDRDTGVIIAYDCEQPGITGSVLLPAGSRSQSINPLTWSRSTDPADNSLNKGACFLSGGQIWLEIPALCGCYIEPERGALVVTGLNYADFPTDSDILPPGNLHEYDYQFFYRNLQENVRVRTEQFLSTGR